MLALRRGVCAFLSIALTANVLVACGGDDDSNDDGTSGKGGSSGTAGAAAGGSGNEAGQAGEGTGTGGAGALGGEGGHSETGGRGGTAPSGGNAGTSASGGSGGNVGPGGEAGEGGAAGGPSGGSAGTGGGCAGAPTGSCACVRVAPDGDDAAAAASDGELPFRNVAPAIDFAAAHPERSLDVCVAAGESCGGTATYSGPQGSALALRNRVSVYGKYESTSWTRCLDSTTRLDPSTPTGVVFGSDIVAGARLDGFDVRAVSAPTSAAVTADGALGVVLEDVRLLADSGDATVEHAIGLDAKNGATVTLSRSSVRVTGGTLDTTGVRAVGARVALVANCPNAPAEGAACNASPENGTGEPRSIRVSGPRDVVGVRLEDSPGSRVERSSVLAQASLDGDDPSLTATSVSVVGDALGTELEDSYFEAAFGNVETLGIALEDCAGAAPVIAGSTVRAKSKGYDASNLGPFDPGALRVEGIRSRGDCHPEITSNDVTAAGSTESVAIGVLCTSSLGVPSRCRLIANAIDTTITIEPRSFGSSASGIGVSCGDCAEISHNVIVGVSADLGCVRNCETSAIGLSVSGSTLVDGNVISAGVGGGPFGVDTGTLTGIAVSGSVRLENNVVDGGGAPGGGTVARTSGIAIYGGAVDVHSNDVSGGSPNTLACGSPVLSLLGANQVILRNNFLGGSTCGAPIEEQTLDADPAVVENNDLVPGAPGGVLYLDQGATDPRTAQEVNDLPDIQASGNLSAACSPLAGSPCVNAGTLAGAPAFDREGDPRDDGRPDIGSDEYAPSACDGVACSGHGSCRVADGGAACECDQGFAPAAGNPLACDDADECAVDNGGCDPLTQCTNVPGTRTCGACPSGYSGNGDVGCTPFVACNPNPCQRGAVCFEEDSSYVCDCPEGTFGRNCEHVFASLAVGTYHECGVLDDGSARCWGDNGYAQSNPPPAAFRTFALGEGHSCAIQTNGTLACFGRNDLGRASPPPGTFQKLSVSDANGCGVKTDGTLACWGYDGQGQSSPPAGAFTDVTAGGVYGCAIRNDGTLACWGYNADGQATPPAGTFKAIAAGARHACALRSNDTLACWGSNEDGQATPPSGAFVSLGSGASHSCALRADGTAACWGQLNGFGTTVTTGTFSWISIGSSGGCGLRPSGRLDCWGTNASTRVPGGAFREVGAGCDLALDGTLECDFADAPSGAFTALGAGGPGCAIRTDHTLAGWGYSFYGANIPPQGTFDAVALSQSHRCALRTDGTLACWGSNGVGESNPPSGTFGAVAAGSGFGCGIRADETLDCWGYDGEGQSSPPFGAFRAVAARYLFACALRVDGMPVCWGRNGFGQLDAPAGPFTDIVVGSEHACALRPDGTIACWGDDSNGQASPPSGAFDQIAASDTSTCALRPDGTVTCFGSPTR